MKQVLENLVKEWWWRPLPKILSRQVNLTEFVAVVGFRRVGKTYLLFDLTKKIGQQKGWEPKVGIEPTV